MGYPLSLAWRQLAREPMRMVVAGAGVAFAVTLIFMQLGFQRALFDSAVRLHTRLDGDMFLISRQSDYLVGMKPFSRRRLYQAGGFRGVESVHAIYTGLTAWKNPATHESRNIFAIGFDPKDSIIKIAGLTERLRDLQMPDVVLYDRLSRPEFGPVVSWFDAGRPVATEAAGRAVRVVGLFDLGTSFGIDGNLITSDINFLRILTYRSPGLIDIGLIRVAPGFDPQAVRDTLAASLPKDVLVLTKQQFAEREKHFWGTSMPIGFLFSFGAAMGLVVGTIIVYQILFADVSDHLTEYATLKAMGYTNAYLFAVVLQQAIILALLGYVPGLAISWELYRRARESTHLPLQLTLSVSAAVLGLTVLMCCISGAITLRKIRSADPAEIF